MKVSACRKLRIYLNKVWVCKYWSSAYQCREIRIEFVICRYVDLPNESSVQFYISFLSEQVYHFTSATTVPAIRDVKRHRAFAKAISASSGVTCMRAVTGGDFRIETPHDILNGESKGNFQASTRTLWEKWNHSRRDSLSTYH
jgi:hypothetical protein